MEITIRLVKLLNIVAMALPIYFLWAYNISSQYFIRFYFWGNVAMAGIFALLYCAYARTYDVFRLGLTRISELFYGQVLSAFFSDCIMYLISTLFFREFRLPWNLLVAFAIQIVIAVLWSRIGYKVYTMINPAMPTLVVYDEREDFKGMVEKYGMDNRFDIKLCLRAEDALKSSDCMDGIKCVFLFGVHSHDRNIIIKECIARNIQCYLLPRIGDVIMSGARQARTLALR